MISNNPPLLFIHGFRGDGSGLEKIAEKLPEYNVYCPTLPPANKQSLLAYNADRYAEWINSYITKNKLQKPVLIGHSMGSIIAAAVASKYPQIINDKIILLAPISSKPNKFFATISPLSAILPTKAVDFITTKYLIVSKGKESFKDILKTTNRCSSNYSSKTDIFKTAVFSVKHCVGDFNFTKDTLVIAGSSDRLISRSKTEALCHKINAKEIILDGTGHLLNYEQPSAVADTIRQFLASGE